MHKCYEIENNSMYALKPVLNNSATHWKIIIHKQTSIYMRMKQQNALLGLKQNKNKHWRIHWDYFKIYLSEPLPKPIQLFLLKLSFSDTCKSSSYAYFRSLCRNTYFLMNPSSLSSRSFRNVTHFWKMQLM